MNKINYIFTPMPKYARSLLSPNAYILLSYLIDEWNKAGCCPFDAANAFFEYVIGITDKTLTKAIRELEYYRLINYKSVGKGRGKINSTWEVLTDNFNYWKDVPYSTMLKIRDELSSEKLRTKTTVFEDDDLKRKKILPKKAEYFRTKKDTKKEYNLDNKLDKLENKLDKKEEEKNNLEVLTDFDNNFISPSKDMLTASLEDRGKTRDETSNTEGNTSLTSTLGEREITLNEFKRIAIPTLSYLYKKEASLGTDKYTQCRDAVRAVLKRSGMPLQDIHDFITNGSYYTPPPAMDWEEALQDIAAIPAVKLSA